MSRILVVSPSFSLSHINPFVGVVERLKEAGHHVGWLSPDRPPGKFEADIRRLAVDLLPTPHHNLPPAVAFTHSDIEGYKASRLKMNELLPARAESLRPLIREFRPDAILLNNISHSGVVAVALERIPFISATLGLYAVRVPGYPGDPWFDGYDALVPPVRQMFQRLGVSVNLRKACAMSTTHVNVSFSTEALLGRDIDLPPNLVLVGPSMPLSRSATADDFPWDRVATDRPVIYAAAGSVYSNIEFYKRIASAADQLGAQLVVSADPNRLEGIAGDVLAATRVPQVELLPKVSAFVTHGGVTSVHEALAHGIPMAVVPFGSDQGFNAYVVQRSGAGLALSGPELGVHEARAALETLISPDSSQRRRARAIQRSYRERDGAWAVSKLLEAAARGIL